MQNKTEGFRGEFRNGMVKDKKKKRSKKARIKGDKMRKERENAKKTM